MNISAETLDIIQTELTAALDRCRQELECTFKNKDINNEFRQYWSQRKEALEKALKELK